MLPVCLIPAFWALHVPVCSLACVEARDCALVGLLVLFALQLALAHIVPAPACFLRPVLHLQPAEIYLDDESITWGARPSSSTLSHGTTRAYWLGCGTRGGGHCKSRPRLMWFLSGVELVLGGVACLCLVMSAMMDHSEGYVPFAVHPCSRKQAASRGYVL